MLGILQFSKEDLFNKTSKIHVKDIAKKWLDVLVSTCIIIHCITYFNMLTNVKSTSIIFEFKTLWKKLSQNILQNARLRYWW